MLSVRLVKKVILVCAIVLWLSGHEVLSMLAVSAVSLYLFYDIQRKAYFRLKRSNVEQYKNVQIEQGHMADVEIVSCRGNVYDVYYQDADLILDKW